jgi:glycerol-3-phosphate dehydrogenase subunit B
VWDGIIVGGGLAGLITGIRASERGKRMLIISEGVGSLTYSSGVIDFGDFERLARQEEHPYALLGESVVRAAADFFQSHFPEYLGRWGMVREVLTPLGSPRKANLVPKRFNAEALRDAQKIILVAPQGMKDFYPEVCKVNLERAYPDGTVELFPIMTERFELWYQEGKSVPGMDYAKFWQTDEGIAALREILKSIDSHIKHISQQADRNPKTVVIFPGLTAEFSKVLEGALAEVPFPVLEMMSFPPSASGQSLYEVLKRTFKSLGGELLVGTGVKHVEIQGKLCKNVVVSSKGRDSSFSARSFVLATGGIFGGGLKVTPFHQQENVFGLPLFVPSDWTQPEFLGEQPYARMGVEVDQALNPLNPQSREIILENVQVVGRMLAHFDPWVEHCGGGVSLASGWLAGESI